MKSLKKWFYRWLNPVQVGDVWEYKNDDPFDPIHFVDTVLDVSNGYAQFERLYVHLDTKRIQSDNLFWFTGPARKLISEKQ